MTRGPHRVAAAFMAGKRTRHSTWILGTWRGMRLDGQDGPTLRAPADSLLAQLWALARAVADPAARLSLSLFSLHLFTVHTANSAFRRWHRRRKFATVFFESACNISCLQGSTGVPARNVCPKRFGSHSWQKCLNILRCNFHCESTNKFLCHKTYLLTHANCTENIYTQL
jgi:hypothetical protein